MMKTIKEAATIEEEEVKLKPKPKAKSRAKPKIKITKEPIEPTIGEGPIVEEPVVEEPEQPKKIYINETCTMP